MPAQDISSAARSPSKGSSPFLHVSGIDLVMSQRGNQIDVIRDLIDARACPTTKAGRFVSQFTQYIDFFDAECRGCSRIVHAAESYADFLKIIGSLDELRSLPRHEVVTKLSNTHFTSTTPEFVDPAIDLAVRRWLMLNVTDPFSQIRLLWPQTVALHWREEESLLGFIARSFPGPRTTMTIDTTNYLDDAFNAISITKYAKLEIRFTTSLEDHLRLRFDGRGRVLRVFNHKMWLLKQLRPAGARVSGFVSVTFNCCSVRFQVPPQVTNYRR